VREILGAFLMCLSTAFTVYLYLWVTHDWRLKMEPTGHLNSPYRELIPSECRLSASSFGDTRTDQTLWENMKLTPSTRIYSLSNSEEKLGFGMKGIPCMGYNFLMVLHARQFKAIEKYVDKDGEVVGTITYEIYRPYRLPVSREKRRELAQWPELDVPPKNDATLALATRSNR